MKMDDSFSGKPKKKRNKRKVKQPAGSKPVAQRANKDKGSENVDSEPQTSTGNSSEIKPVDLKQVDFARFRGGSLPEKRHNEVEARFKGKVRFRFLLWNYKIL